MSDRPSTALPPRINAIVVDEARRAHISVAELLGPSRRREYAWPRQRAMAAICALTPQPSLSQVGRWFGRDHSTVLAAIAAVKARDAITDTRVADEAATWEQAWRPYL